MKEQIEEIINKLNAYIQETDEVDDDELEGYLYEITDELDEIEDNSAAIEPLLHFIENNPDLYYGVPGPLGHFMEKHYKKGYEELLVSSIERNPTLYTLQLLHRLINDRENPNHQNYLAVMKKISLSKEYSEDIIEEANDSLSYFE